MKDIKQNNGNKYNLKYNNNKCTQLEKIKIYIMKGNTIWLKKEISLRGETNSIGTEGFFSQYLMTEECGLTPRKDSLKEENVTRDFIFSQNFP